MHSGQTTQVTCLVSEGDLPLNVTWSFQGRSIELLPGVSTTQIRRKASLLLIDPVVDSHRGQYTCTVMNRAGHANYTTSLDVYGRVLHLNALTVSCLLSNQAFCTMWVDIWPQKPALIKQLQSIKENLIGVFLVVFLLYLTSFHAYDYLEKIETSNQKFFPS